MVNLKYLNSSLLLGNPMSETISFKVPHQIKEKMKALSSRIKWSEELRRYVADKIKQLEREQAIKETRKLLKDIRPAPSGTSTRILREDRESH